MSVDAMAESLNFPNQKRRAVASRSYRVKISPNNGQTFTAGQTVNIDMPSNLAGTYVNWNQCYLKFKAATATNPMTLDRCGAAGLISRIQCQTAGGTNLRPSKLECTNDTSNGYGLFPSI